MAEYICNPAGDSTSWLYSDSGRTLPLEELIASGKTMNLSRIRRSLNILTTFHYHNPHAAVRFGSTQPSGQTYEEVYCFIASLARDLPIAVPAPTDPSAEPTPHFDTANPLPWLQHFIKHASSDDRSILANAVALSGLPNQTEVPDPSETVKWFERVELLVGLFARDQCTWSSDEPQIIDLKHFEALIISFDERLSGSWEAGQIVPHDVKDETYPAIDPLFWHLHWLWVRSNNPSALSRNMNEAGVTPLILIDALNAAVEPTGIPKNQAHFDLLFDLFIVAAVFDITSSTDVATLALIKYRHSEQISADTKWATWIRIRHLGDTLKMEMKLRWGLLMC